MRPRRESSAVYGFIDAALERSRRPYTSTVSAEVVGSWIRRLCHHLMSPCELWDAQSLARRPHRLSTDSSGGADASSERAAARRGSR